jgi:hypothetical protein
MYLSTWHSRNPHVSPIRVTFCRYPLPQIFILCIRPPLSPAEDGDGGPGQRPVRPRGAGAIVYDGGVTHVDQSVAAGDTRAHLPAPLVAFIVGGFWLLEC